MEASWAVVQSRLMPDEKIVERDYEPARRLIRGALAAVVRLLRDTCWRISDAAMMRHQNSRSSAWEQGRIFGPDQPPL
jgi:hypothetical protein